MIHQNYYPISIIIYFMHHYVIHMQIVNKVSFS